METISQRSYESFYFVCHFLQIRETIMCRIVFSWVIFFAFCSIFWSWMKFVQFKNFTMCCQVLNQNVSFRLRETINSLLFSIIFYIKSLHFFDVEQNPLFLEVYFWKGVKRDYACSSRDHNTQILVICWQYHVLKLLKLYRTLLLVVRKISG